MCSASDAIGDCMKDRVQFLKDKALQVRLETLRIHGIAPETRLASSLSDVEIFVSLFYGKILNFNPRDIYDEERDRFFISKGHGAISLYPILADLGFFDKKELDSVCKEGTFLGGIPDTKIPGFETINGSLGLGLGIACGAAIALKRKKSNAKVFVLSGDGELFVGTVWEAIMFAPQHRLGNLILIVDNNKRCMLDYCKNIIDLSPLEEKFRCFHWDVRTVNGHDIEELTHVLNELKEDGSDRPKVVIADTVKGKGVKQLEDDPLCHIKSLSREAVSCAIKELE